MSQPGSKSALVLELAAEFLTRYRRGERPSLTEYIDRYPQLAEQIRDVFPAMALRENITIAAESLGEASGGRQAPESPRQIGDYRILREVGRGGMGVVYEAEQVSLGRHVALKVLPQKVLDDRSRQRFEREARAAARLHHTNIVPVFGVGEHDGLPYYVMQFIRGQGLDQVLEEVRRLGGGHKPIGQAVEATLPTSHQEAPAAEAARSLLSGVFQPDPDVTMDEPRGRGGEPAPPAGGPAVTWDQSLPSGVLLGQGAGPGAVLKGWTYWQSVAHVGVQVAAALDHAHQQGVIHRDIKPSNLLLDAAGTVWVTDFGLAKADGSENLTHTGDILGTLRYMPPEAFDGQADARSDIYSLGLTLYEMAALRPAFDERDRPRLIKEVTTTEAPRLQRLVPAIPRDLATIVHKAIEREPAHRYASAGELAADLQRFLNDEPIKARRQSAGERFGRWCRRHPVEAALGLSVLALLLLLAAGASVAAVWLHRERSAMLAEQRRANQAEADRLTNLAHGILTTAPENVLVQLAELRSGSEPFQPRFRQAFADAPPGSRERLRAAIALAYLGEPPTDFLLDQVGTAPTSEFRNLASVLALTAAEVRQPLRDRARAEGDLTRKSRLAALALQLGDVRPARERLAEKPDPAERVHFICRFPPRGHWAALPSLLRGTDDPAFQSGLCAALGQVDRDEWPTAEYQQVEEVLRELYAGAAHGGTHSAAGWALRRWQTPLPPLPRSARPAPDRAWFVNGRGVTMIRLDPGFFWQADLAALGHAAGVVLPRSFFMSDRELWTGLFLEFVGDTDYPADLKPAGWKGPDRTLSPLDECPVTRVSPADMFLFCNWLSTREGRQPCYRRVADKGGETWGCDFEADGYRLPTEAEWEYACRAGAATLYPVGDEPDFLDSFANVDRMRTEPGRSRLPNAWGLFDLTGNLWEVCWPTRPDNAASVASTPQVEPRGPDTTMRMAMRGTAYGAGSYYSRFGIRFAISGDERRESIGCHLVCRQPEPPADERRRADALEERLADLGRQQDRQEQAAALWQQLGAYYACRGQPERGLAWLQRAVDLRPNSTMNWMRLAIARLYLDDGDGYRRTCREMLGRFGKTTSAFAADQTAKACLLLPAEPDNEEPRRLATLAVTAGAREVVHLPFFQFCRGLAEYRAGRHAEAVMWLDRCLGNASLHPATRASGGGVLAMAYRRMGDPDRAVQALEAARNTLRTGPSRDYSQDPAWQDWLIAELLIKEATAVLQAGQEP